MKQIINIIFIVAVTVFVSCSELNTTTDITSPTDSCISFIPYVNESVDTKATVIEGTSLEGDNFAIIGYYQSDESYPDVFTGKVPEGNDYYSTAKAFASNGKYITEPYAIWNAKAQLYRFFAYYPDDLGFQKGSFNYELPTSPDDMTDILTASKEVSIQYDEENGKYFWPESVDLTFDHRLWALDFSVTNTANEEISVNSVNLVILGVPLKGTIPVVGKSIVGDEDLLSESFGYNLLSEPTQLTEEGLAFEPLLFLPYKGNFYYRIEIEFANSKGNFMYYYPSANEFETINQEFLEGTRYSLTVDKSDAIYITWKQIEWDGQEITHTFE